MWCWFCWVASKNKITTTTNKKSVQSKEPNHTLDREGSNKDALSQWTLSYPPILEHGLGLTLRLTLRGEECVIDLTHKWFGLFQEGPFLNCHRRKKGKVDDFYVSLVVESRENSCMIASVFSVKHKVDSVGWWWRKQWEIFEETGGGHEIVIKEQEIKLTRETKVCKDSTMYSSNCVTIKLEARPGESVFL